MKSREERKCGRKFGQSSYTVAKMLRLLLLFLAVKEASSCGPGTFRPGPKHSRYAMRLYEKYPDKKETSSAASGRSFGRVYRESPAYKSLVGNYNPDIIFKGNKNQDDRRMTKRCSEKLKRLADKVKQEWSEQKIQLRVIEAFSDGRNGKHEKHSLHYEGRAVDITTSDEDRKKYGRLGRLAHEAGFDWVYYGWESHIHASVKTDSAGENEGMGCFPGQASVLLENGKRVAMAELRAGDRVQSVDKQGNIVFSPIMLFLDYRPKVTLDFVLIETEEPQRKLVINGPNLIYQLNKQTRRESVVFAQDLQVGDYVYITNSTNSKRLTACRVTRVTRKTNIGVYAPLTEQGNVFVDGILCSCYAIVDHELAHWSFFPIRFMVNSLPSLMKWVDNTTEGIHWYAKFLQKIYPIWLYGKLF